MSISWAATPTRNMMPSVRNWGLRAGRTACAPCEYSHTPNVCRCSMQLHQIGEDERLYNAYARERKGWVIRGVRGLTKKMEVPGEMVSAFQDELRGFGLPISEAELAQVNELRRQKGCPALKATLSLCVLVHGKNKQEWLGYDQFEEQVVDVMDYIDVIALTKQLMMEVNPSAGHAKFR